jgi:uncharacterized protein YukE
MSITPEAIQDLLDELEASRQARRRAWDVLQELRAVLTNLGNLTIETPSRKSFEIEGAILKQALSDCLRDQRAALAQLADAAKEVDREPTRHRSDSNQEEHRGSSLPEP